MLMEPASAEPADRRWAGFMKWTESTVVQTEGMGCKVLYSTATPFSDPFV